MALRYETLDDPKRAIACALESLLIHREIEDPFTPKVEAWLRQRGIEP